MTESSWRDLGGPVAGGGESTGAKRSTSRARDGGQGGRSRDDLYTEAKRRNIRGRSGMTKEQLERALRS
jgi:hypothetical protein